MNTIKIPMERFSYDKERGWLVCEHSDISSLFDGRWPQNFVVVSSSGTEVGFFYDRDFMVHQGTEDEELGAKIYTNLVGIDCEVHILND
jgi:hypothetical protein